MNTSKIINNVNDVYILMKAYRRVLGISQRKLAKNLLCGQATVCRYETKQLKYLSEYEQERILYNFSIDFNERVKERGNKVTKNLFCINVCAAYLELTKDKNYRDKNDIVNLIVELSEDLIKCRAVG